MEGLGWFETIVIGGGGGERERASFTYHETFVKVLYVFF